MLGLGNSLVTGGVVSAGPLVLYTTNLIGWWDFTDVAQMYVEKDAYTTQVSSDGDAIGRVKNKAETTPLGNFLRASGDTDRPLYKTGGTGGYSYALFDGSNDHLLGKKDTGTNYGAVSGSAFSTAEIDQQASTFFAVISFTSATLGSANEKVITIAGRDAADGVNNIQITRGPSNEQMQGFVFSHDDDNDNLFFNDSGFVDTTTLATVSFHGGTDKAIVYKNGTPDTNSSDTLTSNNTILFNGHAMDGVLIGENFHSTFGAIGGSNLPASVYEILVYNEAMSDANRESVEAFLINKYSI